MRIASSSLNYRILFLTLFVLISPCNVDALLKVIESETREFKTLDGFWDFLPDYTAKSVDDKWWKTPLRERAGNNVDVMPVPSSFNDITNSPQLRDHLGWVWYETYFSTPTSWLNSTKQYDPGHTRRIFLRFESAHYYAMVFLNGKFVMDHSVGHLPFEAEVGSLLETNGDLDFKNRLTVAINSTLNSTTVPPSAYNYKQNSSSMIYPEGFVEVTWQFDFFNYAGIHRPVKLFSTGPNYITDVTIKTTPENLQQKAWSLSVKASAKVTSSDSSIRMTLIEKDGAIKTVLGVLKIGEEKSVSVITDQVWWPYTMREDYGVMSTLKLELLEGADNKTVDVYFQKFSFRHVSWNNTTLLINGEKTYLTGINKHEDSDIRGKGLDYALIARDFENQRWLGSNAFRTSHYPYAEEYLEMADKMGIMVIGECPGVGIQSQNMVDETRDTHERSIREMIARDKNHPSIIMWSLANEPSSDEAVAEDYFRHVFSESRQLDDTRPFTFVSCKEFDKDVVFQFSDFLNINKYIGWYQDVGMNNWLVEEVTHYVTNYFNQHQKPVIMQEYGAGTIAGFHKSPAAAFNEEYQVNVLNWTGEAFDRMRPEFFVGEFIWNYADFMTEPAVTRVDGNKKGIFTRQRQPKMGAHFLRQRYLKINAQMINNINKKSQRNKNVFF